MTATIDAPLTDEDRETIRGQITASRDHARHTAALIIGVIDAQQQYEEAFKAAADSLRELPGYNVEAPAGDRLYVTNHDLDLPWKMLHRLVHDPEQFREDRASFRAIKDALYRYALTADEDLGTVEQAWEAEDAATVEVETELGFPSFWKVGPPTLERPIEPGVEL